MNVVLGDLQLKKNTHILLLGNHGSRQAVGAVEQIKTVRSTAIGTCV